MDETTTKLVVQWTALILMVVFFVVSAVKFSRGLAVVMFGFMLMNAGFVAGNYGVNALPIVIVSMLIESFGAYMLLNKQTDNIPPKR